MTQICTSIEQSKKLIELGLDKSTADMAYRVLAHANKVYPTAYVLCLGESLIPDKEDIPAWSLGALLELTPNYGLHHIGGKCSCVFYSAPRISPHPQYISDRHDNIFEAVYDMVVWLLENNYIKTEKT